MSDNKVAIRLLHKSSIQGGIWCEPAGWKPANDIEGAEFVDGSWWAQREEVAGLVWFGNPVGCEDEIIEVSLECISVASCGDCRVIGDVKL